MKAFSPLALCALLAWSAPFASALDFTIRHGTTAADGASLDSTYITDRDSKIYMRIPHQWKFADGPGALEFIPDVPGCIVRLENVPGGRDLPLDEGGKVALRQKLDAAVPGGAKNVAPLPEVDNPLPIYGWKDVEMGRTYEFYGQTICHSMLFLNMRPGRVVQVTVSAPKGDYDKVHDAVRRLMYSWFEPGKDLPPDVARMLENGKLGGS